MCCQLGIEPPGRDDSDRSLVVSVRMVVDCLKGGAVGGLAGDEPFGASVVYLSLGMVLLDRLLDIGRVEASLPEPVLSVLGPDEALDSTGRTL